MDWSSYPNFDEAEFRCRCGCGKAAMDPMFLERLQAIRSHLARPLRITSGYRCEAHNRAVGSTTNNHVLGLAADVGCATSGERFELVQAALLFDVVRIGVHRGFVHLDLHRAAPQRMLWLYGN